MEKRAMDAWAKGYLAKVGTEYSRKAAMKHNYYLSVGNRQLSMPHYWDGGSRSDWTLFQLSTGKAFTMPDNHPAFCPNMPYTLNEIPPDCVIVETGVSCGKTATAHFYVREMVGIA